MKIIQILPEIDIGGVERHVIDLSNELTKRGYGVVVISAGGKMQPQLSDKVEHRMLPVHKKNPFTGWLCAKQIAGWIKDEGWQIIHAHSRVPAWIADWASSLTGVPFIVTAHVDFGNKNPWIYRPYRRASRVICVSKSVKEGMKNCFYDNATVVTNGLDEPKCRWYKPPEPPVKFLFVGRLSAVKGLQDMFKAMPIERSWTIDVLGDGPMRQELEKLTESLGISERVKFHGYSDQVDTFMANSSCLLFPSYIEGYGLTLARAVQIGLPVIASNIGPVAEMAGTSKGLLPPGDIEAWRNAIADFIATGMSQAIIPVSNILTLDKMVDSNESIYQELIGSQ